MLGSMGMADPAPELRVSGKPGSLWEGTNGSCEVSCLGWGLWWRKGCRVGVSGLGVGRVGPAGEPATGSSTRDQLGLSVLASFAWVLAVKGGALHGLKSSGQICPWGKV